MPARPPRIVVLGAVFPWVVVLGVAVLALVLTACDRGGQSFRSTDITGADFGKTFQLTDHDGQPRSLADFRGKVVVVFFGFTHCPDVCPTTLAELARAIKELGPDGERVQVLMVTVDPERDTPDVLKQYVTALDPSFIGLTGDPEAISRTAREFKVFYQKSPGASPQVYSVDHSSGSYVFDPQGRLRLLVSYGQGADVIAHDIAQLLKAS
jgi:protein SCO1